MGHQATAVCDSCNYEADYVVGGNMANFREVAMFPVCCDVCRALTSANFMQRPLKCGHCGASGVRPFTDAGMSKGDGKDTAEEWLTPGLPLRLDDGHYRCPKCGEFCLRFAVRQGRFFD
jgi:hypothetical protein